MYAACCKARRYHSVAPDERTRMPTTTLASPALHLPRWVLRLRIRTRWVTVLAFLSALLVPTAQAQIGVPWNRSPSVTVVAKASDPRIGLVQDAVAFWNSILAEVGSSFRIGAVSRVERPIPVEALQQQSRATVAGPDGEPGPLAGILDGMPGDIVVFLADAAFVSYVAPYADGGRRVVAIRRLDLPPFNQPNVAPNLIAHEMGHAIGLGHNADPKFLMCGRPAACRPPDFASTELRMFPLTDGERQELLALYPRGWR